MDTAALGIIAPHPPIMVPEVGGADAEVTCKSAAAMRQAERLLEAFEPDVVLLMSPHAPLARDAFLIDDSDTLSGDLAAFRAPQVSVSPTGDPEFARAVIAEATASGIPVAARTSSPVLDAGLLDHGALVPLSFLDRSGRYPIVELSLSFLPLDTHRMLGRAIKRAGDRLGRRVAFLASGDCSHRLTPDAPAGYSPRAAEFDAQLVRLLAQADYRNLQDIDRELIEAAGECGLRSFITLGGFLEGTDAETRVLSYEGPWGVGYLTAVAASPHLLDRVMTPESGHKGGKPGEDESPPVALARTVIETYITERRVIATPSPKGVLASRNGAFVSLHRRGDLRGCIGTIEPTTPNLAEEIIHNAVRAATEDPRFPPLEPDELGDLEISVDVLHEPEPASMADLDPRTFGVIVSADWRRGLLLPDLEGVDSAEDQIAIAARKAGIAPGERLRIERFRVDRYH
ncbi:MAG: AmmeMemoRadiSam system protein A [Coriobacteriia bacterium]|nr:AmmeMemoRadiSam system protein A [Coriobacteriia bacterium]